MKLHPEQLSNSGKKLVGSILSCKCFMGLPAHDLQPPSSFSLWLIQQPCPYVCCWCLLCHLSSQARECLSCSQGGVSCRHEAEQPKQRRQWQIRS